MTVAIVLPEPGDVDGYVVMKGQTSICRAKSPISETSDSIQRRDCTPDHRLSKQDVVYSHFATLEGLSRWQPGCGVQDGVSFRIDGIFHGRRFFALFEQSRLVPRPRFQARFRAPIPFFAHNRIWRLAFGAWHVALRGGFHHCWSRCGSARFAGIHRADYCRGSFAGCRHATPAFSGRHGGQRRGTWW